MLFISTFRTANLVYMRYFHLAKMSDDDEFGFYLASVEAALEHIKSGSVSDDMKIIRPKVRSSLEMNKFCYFCNIYTEGISRY